MCDLISANQLAKINALRQVSYYEIKERIGYKKSVNSLKQIFYYSFLCLAILCPIFLLSIYIFFPIITFEKNRNDSIFSCWTTFFIYTLATNHYEFGLGTTRYKLYQNPNIKVFANMGASYYQLWAAIIVPKILFKVLTYAYSTLLMLIFVYKINGINVEEKHLLLYCGLASILLLLLSLLAVSWPWKVAFTPLGFNKYKLSLKGNSYYSFLQSLKINSYRTRAIRKTGTTLILIIAILLFNVQSWHINVNNINDLSHESNSLTETSISIIIFMLCVSIVDWANGDITVYKIKFLLRTALENGASFKEIRNSYFKVTYTPILCLSILLSIVLALLNVKLFVLPILFSVTISSANIISNYLSPPLSHEDGTKEETFEGIIISLFLSAGPFLAIKELPISPIFLFIYILAIFLGGLFCLKQQILYLNSK
ncbi:MAG: hypothetical protein QM632_02735 [Micrococcaceae bacterium]